jgi:phosphoserine aminotransferase
MLPEEVLAQAGNEILDCKGSGQSVMEMSHRSKSFIEIFEETKADFKELLNVPDTHEVLFLQGGASGQFSAVPLNLIGATGKADYAITGNFSNLAYKEAKKFGGISVAASSADANHTFIPAQSDLKINHDASYFYYCANNTIYGTEWQYIPETGSVPLVSDMSSNIMSRAVDVGKYGVIFAGAQKNMAPAGVTVVIVRKDLSGHALPGTPVVFDYATMIEKDSMYNTPPCWCVYILGKVLKWVKANGGVSGMEELKMIRSGMVYDYLDNSKLFKAAARREARSGMNVTFVTGNADLDKQFAAEASEKGLVNLSGHRSVGGMRASMYNAMPIEGAKALVEFMKEFERANV